MPYSKEKQAEYQAKWIAKRRADWLAKAGPCVDCGATTDLQVHHKNPKLKNEHRVWSWSEKRRLRELKKCEVLCRKCHSRRHRPVPDHGTNSRYTSMDPAIRCRCPECREAHRRVAARYRGLST